MAMNKKEQAQLDAAIRLIKAMRNPDADVMKARTDAGMALARKELRDAEENAKAVGLVL